MPKQQWEVLLENAPKSGPGSLEDMAKAIIQLEIVMPLVTPNATGYSHSMGLLCRDLLERAMDNTLRHGATI